MKILEKSLSDGTRTNSLLRTGAIVFLAQTSVNVLNFVFHFFVSRRVGVAAYGSLNALIAGFTLFTTPAIILTTVVVKYASEFFSGHEGGRLRSLISVCFRFFGFAALALVGVGIASAPRVSAFLHIGATLPVILTFGILAGNVILPVRGVLQGIEDFGSFAFSITAEAVIKVALAVLLTGLGFGISGALTGWLGGLVVSAVYTYSVLGRRFGNETARPLHLDYARLFKTTGFITLATLLVSSLGFSDVVLVKHFFDARSAGLYSAAALCGKMIFMLVSFVPAVILPRAAALTNKGRSATAVLAQGLFVSGVLIFGALALYLLLPALVISTLAGHAFAGAASLVFPYGVAAALLSTLNTVVYYKIGAHDFGFLPALAVVAAAQLILLIMLHASVVQVITILIICNMAALTCSVWGTNFQALLFPKQRASVPDC